jgi:flagellar biosynthetic protein FliO
MGDPGSLPGIGSYLLTVTLVLLAVLGLAVGFIVLMRRLVPRPGSGRTIRLVETVPLEPRRALHLVTCGDRILLVGSTDGSIRTLATFARDEVDLEQKPRTPLRFIDLLRGRRGDQSS